MCSRAIQASIDLMIEKPEVELEISKTKFNIGDIVRYRLYRGKAKWKIATIKEKRSNSIYGDLTGDRSTT